MDSLLPKHLHGKIKSLKTTDSNNGMTHLTFDTAGRIRSMDTYENGTIVTREMYQYDKFGNEVSYEKYEHVPELLADKDGLSLSEEARAEYNDQNLLIYEFKGQITTEHDWGWGNYYDYKFDNVGRIIKKITMDTGKTPVEVTEYAFHDNGQLKSEITYSTPANTEDRRFERHYDQEGLSIDARVYIDYKDGSPVTDTTYRLSEVERY